MKVLWVGHNLAFPPKGGALQRNYNLLREIARKCEVHVLAFDQPITRPADVTPKDCVQALGQFCTSVDWVALAASSGFFRRYRLAVKGLISGEPYDFVWLYSNEMARKLSRLAAEVRPDVVHIDALGLAQYLPVVGEVGAVLNHHDVESCKIGVRGENDPNPLLRTYFKMEAKKLRIAEQRWCPQFGVNVVVSAEEGALLTRVCPNLVVQVVPNGVDTQFFTPRPDPDASTVLFCGSMDMHPNQEAVEYFVKRIWPLILAKVPEARFQIVGRRPPDWVVEMEKRDSRIQVTGYVDDVRPYFQQATVCVCPILSGGGTRLKILDSLAMGVPVVSTSFAASGLSLEDNRHLLLADRPESFADRTLRLLADRSLRERLAAAGAEQVDQLYSWSVVGRSLLDAYEFARARHRSGLS